MPLRMADEGFSMDVTSDLILMVLARGICSRNPSGATGLEDCHREQSHLGGICLKWGCIPTKALLKSAELYSRLSHLEGNSIACNGRQEHSMICEKNTKDKPSIPWVDDRVIWNDWREST